MKHRVAIAALACGILAAPVWAGVHYTSTTKIVASQGGPQTMRAEGWAEGNSAKIEFVESTNPIMGKGTYLLTTDGGKTLLLVDPADKTYSPFDIAGMAQGAAMMMRGMGNMMKMTFTNQKVEKLAEEAGPSILGYPTTHYRFKTSYDSEMKVMGMAMASHHETLQDTWTTTRLSDAGLYAWLRREPPKTGNADFDQLMENELKKGITGVPLKIESVSTSKDNKGRETKVTTTMEVTSVKTESVPASTFQVPAGYTETQLAPAGPPAH